MYTFHHASFRFDHNLQKSTPHDAPVTKKARKSPYEQIAIPAVRGL